MAESHFFYLDSVKVKLVNHLITMVRDERKRRGGRMSKKRRRRGREVICQDNVNFRIRSEFSSCDATSFPSFPIVLLL